MIIAIAMILLSSAVAINNIMPKKHNNWKNS